MWVQLLDAILNTPLWINMDNVTAIQTHLGGSLIVTNAPTSASSPTSFAVRESPDTIIEILNHYGQKTARID